MKKFSFVLSKLTISLPKVTEIDAVDEESARSILAEYIRAYGEIENLDTIDIASEA